MRALNTDKFEIRRARRPAIQGGLASTVITPEGYVDIHFNVSLVRRAGKVLERGISRDDPAFMELIRVGGYWILYVRYVNDLQPMYRKKLLWYEQRPQWSKNSKKIDRKKLEQEGEHHAYETQQDTSGSTGTAAGSTEA